MFSQKADEEKQLLHAIFTGQSKMGSLRSNSAFLGGLLKKRKKKLVNK